MMDIIANTVEVETVDIRQCRADVFCAFSNKSFRDRARTPLNIIIVNVGFQWCC